MTLRARLVVALVALLAVGLTVYGIGTYRAFAAAELDRLDAEVRQALPLVVRALEEAAGREPGGRPSAPGRPGPGGPGPAPGQGGPMPRVAPGTYAALYDPDGSLAARIQVADATALPDLSEITSTAAAAPSLVTVGSSEGEGTWRVLVDTASDGTTVVVAVPSTSVDQALRGLLAIEVVAGLALLVALAAGSWLVLRAGLRPLERMAAATATVTAGRLDQRVPVDTPGTEVAQLGTAINGMLDDLEDAFAQRAETEQRLRRFVADASHELRTPLTSIQGYAELLRLDADAPQAEVDTAVRRIEQEAARMRRLVEDLLTLARLDEPRPLAADAVDLTILAADACSDALAIAPDRKVHLDAPDPVRLRGDEAHLRQALTNLLANAVRHTPAAAPIEVSVHRDGGQATVVVRDRGPGLGDAALVHAFDRFWQADPARAGAGTGLGLAIVRAVALEHGGTVRAADDPEGGAVFTLTLPMTPPEEPADVR